MRILAIDPAAHCGFAFSSVKDRAEHSGVWHLGADPAARLENLEFHLVAAVDSHKPEVIAYESATFGSVHVHVMRRHNELAGVIELVARRSGLECWSFPPPSWKARAVGSGRAKKDGVVRGLATFYGIEVNNFDEADAIGILLASQQGPPKETKRAVRSAERKAAKKLPRLFR